MNEFLELEGIIRNYKEAIKIIRVFPSLPIDELLDYIKQYNGLSESERILNVIRDLLAAKGIDNEDNITADAEIIETIFPQFSIIEIDERISNYCYNSNRIKLVIKDIINDHEQNKNLVKAETVTSNELPQEIAQMPSNKRKVNDAEEIVQKQMRLDSIVPQAFQMSRKNMYVNNTNGFIEHEDENVTIMYINNNSIKEKDASNTTEGVSDILNHFNEDTPSTSGNTLLNRLDITQGTNDYVDDFFLNLFNEPGGSSDLKKVTKSQKKEKNAAVRNIKVKDLKTIDLTESENDVISLDDQYPTNNHTKIFHQLMEIFPEAEPDFLRNIIKKQPCMPIDDLITEILSMDYPRRNTMQEENFEIDQEMHYEILKQVLPDADPMYLRQQLEHITSKEEIEAFISESLDKHNYPKYKDYLRKQQLSSQAKQYTTEFNLQKFLEVIPDPINYFKSSEVKAAEVKDSLSFFHATIFLKSQYDLIPLKQIKSVLQASNNILTACSVLDNVKEGFMKSKRKVTDIWKEIPIENIPLVQLFAYIKHKDEIIAYIKNVEKQLKYERKLAKECGLMETCKCCYDEEVMPKDIITCSLGCKCCKSCVSRSVEISFGEGKVDFLCLQDCGAKYTIQLIQSAVQPKLFSKVVQKKQLEEVKAAGIEDLEFCPFCDFANIPAPGDKIFKCLNPECMKESCRECKEPSHVPLKCTEVEKDSEVKLRTYIENKMTEALLRKCWKCGMKFIKSDGCNKMTCTCGASMCYICNKAVTDYKHFNGQGGDRFDLCPLYSDTNKLHKDAVLKSAKEAKAEINASELKIDPSADVQKHYKEWKKKNPAHMPPGI